MSDNIIPFNNPNLPNYNEKAAEDIFPPHPASNCLASSQGLGLQNQFSQGALNLCTNGPSNFGQIGMHPSFGDTERMINMRNWLEKALVAQGAKINGGGMGMGQVDLEFTLEGHKFQVNLSPR